MNEKKNIQAVLFDMDGLVLDTEKLYCRFWQEAANVLGYPMTKEQSLSMRSLDAEASTAQLKSYFGEGISYEEVRNKRIELMNDYIEKEGVDVKEGIFELLDYLQEKGLKKAIVTSSPLDRTKKHLSSVGLEKRFDKLISAYMVERGKPQPDVYLYAAKEIGVKPENCLVLEDSPTGILAAYRAGCLPVMIPDLDQPDEKTKELLFAKIDGLKEVITFLQTR